MTAASIKFHSTVLVLIFSCALSACDGKIPKAEASTSVVIPNATAEVGQTVAMATDNASQVFDDMTTTAKAKWALAGVMELRSMEIFVETVDGHVTLSGNVGSEAELQRAANIVSSLEGVKNVENRLAVKSRV